MNKRNPFKTAEGDESTDQREAPQREPAQREREQQERNKGYERGRRREMADLKDEIRDLRSEMRKLYREEGPGEEDRPEPDFECTGEGCDGWAVEETEPEHVTTKKKLIGENTRPVAVECPRCGEQMQVRDFVEKADQKSGAGGTPLVANQSAAGRAVQERFEEADRREVLEEAESV